MAVKASGTLALDGDVAGEFGGARPHSLSEYYRGGTLVPQSSINQNIPTSGAISLSNFRGGSKFFNSAASISSISTTRFAQDGINQNSLPGVGGSYQKYFFRTFRGFNVTAAGTQITVPNMTITIRGDEEEDKIGSDENTGIRNPGVEIVYRQSRFAAETIVGTFRGSGVSRDDDGGNLNVSVTGGTITASNIGYYTVRWVADVFSEDLGQAPTNIFIASSFQLTAFGVASFSFLNNSGWG
jgi:hypothetical protein